MDPAPRRRWPRLLAVLIAVALGVLLLRHALVPRTAADQLARAVRAEEAWNRARGAGDTRTASAHESDALSGYERTITGGFPPDPAASAEAHRRLARLHATCGRAAESVEWTRRLAQAHAADPALAEALDEAARLAEEKLPPPAARELLEELVRLRPTDPRAPAAALRAARLFEREDAPLEGELGAYREVDRRFPDGDEAAQALWRAAELLEEQSRWAEAAEELARLEQRRPDPPWGPRAMARRAELYAERLGRHEQAAALWRALIERYPDSAEARAARARVQPAEEQAAAAKVERTLGERYGGGSGGLIYDPHARWSEAQRALFARIAAQKLDHRKIEVALRLEPEQSRAQLELSLTFVHRGEPLRQLAWFMGSAARVESAELGGQAAQFAHQEDQLVVFAPDPVLAEEEQVLRLRYALREADPRPPVYQLRLGPEGFAQGESGWVPCNAFGDVYAFRLEVTGPPGVEVIAPGTAEARVETSESWRTTWVSEGQREAFALYFAYGPFHKVERRWGECSLAWLSAEPRADAEARLAQVQSTLETYAGWFGAFPYSKLWVAEVELAPPFAGVGPPSLVWLNRALPADAWKAVLDHELAHQWWGNLVPVALFGTPGYSPWLAEGLATHAELRLAVARSGEEAGAKQLARYRDTYLEATRAVHERSLAEGFAGGPAYFAATYLKGCYVLHSLRWLIGAEAYDRALRRYIAEYAWKGSSVADFRRILEAESGQDLAVFFADWVDGIGAPRWELIQPRRRKLPATPEAPERWGIQLELAQEPTKRWVSDEGEPLAPERAPFRTPVELRVTGRGGEQYVERLALERPREARELVVPFEPASLELDPDGRWLKVEGPHNRHTW